MLLAGGLSLCVLASCGNSSKTLKANTANITKSSVGSGIVNQHDWKLSGTTDAPDGSKIIVYSDDSNTNIATSQNENWAKVKNGKFTAYVDPITVISDGSNDNYTTSKKYTIHTAALSNYSKKKTVSLSKKASKLVKKSAKTYTITLSSAQAAYYNSLNDNNDSNSSSSTADSDSELSEQSNSSSVDKDASSAFSKSVSELAKNIGNSNNLPISAKVSDNGASVVYYVPESASSMSKDDKSTLASDLIPRTDKLADMCSVDQPTDIYIQTADTYKTIAKTTLTGGTKVY